MLCKNCAREFDERISNVCPFCGTVNNLNGKDHKKKEKTIIAVLSAVLAVIVICFAAFAIGHFVRDDRDEPVNVGISDASDDENKEADEDSEEYDDDDKTDDEADETEAERKETKAPTTITQDKLYRPDSSKFCDQYKRYIDASSADQEYAKMRFGPSKTKYDIVGQVPNGEQVTVETVSVDGWTMIYYNGQEGWVRSDFLKEKEKNNNASVQPDAEYCEVIEGYADVDDGYDGEPLNMRSGPGREYSLITKVPDESFVSLIGYSKSNPDWVYVEYNGYRGWILSKYVEDLMDDAVGDKPVLYLYPETKTDIDVKIKLDHVYFSCTYPEYNDGWSVTASPDGMLVNKADGKQYSYLYWELKGKQNYSFDKGFVVKGSETAEFLQEKLSEMGLTPREYNEFIVYWLPKMQENEYNLISFQGNEYTDSCQLDISPEPDSVLRVFMAYKSVDKPFEIEEQKFEKFDRKGFTVVEWGGAEVQ